MVGVFTDLGKVLETRVQKGVLHHHRRHPLVRDADGLRRRLGRVGERPEEVEERRDAELAPRDGGVTQRRMEHRRGTDVWMEG